MTQLRRTRRLGSEQLERRELLTAELVSIRLETLNLAGQIVNKVEIGQQFKLRASAHDSRESGGVFSAFTDVSFNSSRVKPVETVPTPVDMSKAASGKILPDKIDEAGGIVFEFLAPFKKDVILWETQFVALTDGEVIFSSNPADKIGSEILLAGIDDKLTPVQIQFGFTRLLIGNGQASPWTNPKDPADINNDGEVNDVDLKALTAYLGDSASKQLPLSDPAATLVDVNADRLLTRADLILVDERIRINPPPADPETDPDPNPPVLDHASVRLEVLNSAGQAVDHVQVGESFKLRAVVAAEAGYVAEAYVDVTYNGGRVKPMQTVISDATSDFGFFSGVALAEGIEEAGGTDAIHARPQPSEMTLWETPFVASSNGEVVFSSNPADTKYPNFLVRGGLGNGSKTAVDYGFKRLLIGTGQPSPWTNPKNPADVNDDGQVDSADVTILSTLIGSSNSVALPINGSQQFVDADANRSLTPRDIELVRAQIVEPVNWTSNDFLIEVKNLRTGKIDGVVMVGDIVDVYATFNVRNDEASILSFMEATKRVLNKISVLDFNSELISILNVGESGSLTGDLKKRPDDGSFLPIVVAIRMVASKAGTTQLTIIPSKLTLLPTDNAPKSISLTIGESNRPIAPSVKLDLPFDEMTRAELASVIPKEGLVARFDSAHGILSNSTPQPDWKFFPLEYPKFGQVVLSKGGAFEYRLNNNLLKGIDSFKYVAMSNEGTSTVQTVELSGSFPNTLDLQVKFTNAAGEELSQVPRGLTFFVEVSLNTLPMVGFLFHGIGLSADLKVSNSTLELRGQAQVNPLFNGQLGGQNVATTVEADENSIKIDSQGFNFAVGFPAGEFLMRIPVATNVTGEFDLDISRLVVGALDEYAPGDPWAALRPTNWTVLPSNVLSVKVQSLRIVDSEFLQNPVQPLDVNGDGLVTPIDALLGINKLNQSRNIQLRAAGEAAAATDKYFYDANGDGAHSPIDILVVINALNKRAVGEGEQVNLIGAQQIDVDELSDPLKRKTKR